MSNQDLDTEYTREEIKEIVKLDFGHFVMVC
jgi:hypothetical protein